MNAAPRVIIFLDENDTDESQVFLAADENIRIQVQKPSAPKIVLALIAIYWVWHQSYPLIYKHSLEFFSFKIFKTSTTAHGLVGKFLRKLANSKCDDEKSNLQEDEENIENCDD